MKNLSKVIAITAVAAMSFSCLSAYAAEMPGKSGQMSFQPAMAKVEMKIGAGINNEASNKAIPNNGKMNNDALENNINNKNMPSNIVNGMNNKGMRIEKTERFEMTEEKAAKIEELKADLAAKLEAGKITQEEYDEAIAKIEAGDFMRGDKDGRGMKGEKPEKAEMTEEEKAAKIEELKADLAAKLEAGEITQEEYDVKLAKIESGEFKPEFKKKKETKNEKANTDMKHDKAKAPKMNKATDTKNTVETDKTVVAE